MGRTPPRPSPYQGRTPPWPWEEPLLGQVWPRTKGMTYQWEWHSRSFLGIGKVLRQKRTTKRMETSKGKLSLLHSVLCTWQSHAFLPLQPLPTTLGRGWWDKYQHYESKSKRRKLIQKGGDERQSRRDAGTPTTQRILEKAHRIVPRTNLPR